MNLSDSSQTHEERDTIRLRHFSRVQRLFTHPVPGALFEKHRRRILPKGAPNVYPAMDELWKKDCSLLLPSALYGRVARKRREEIKSDNVPPVKIVVYSNGMRFTGKNRICELSRGFNWLYILSCTFRLKTCFKPTIRLGSAPSGKPTLIIRFISTIDNGD
jgi:hypothetical protein